MRPTNWLFWACKFWVAINEQSDMTTACKFQYFHFFASSHYSFHFFELQVFFVVPQVCDTLIYCAWHVNFGWLSTDNPTWLQDVSSNICNSFASSHYSFEAFDLQLFLVCVHRMRSILIILSHILDTFLESILCVFAFQDFRPRPSMSLPKHDPL